MKYLVQEAHWIPSHAERRKRSRHTWTRDEWENHLADKVAEGNIQFVTTALPQVQWTVVSASTAVASVPEVGELYIGDYRGHLKALHGIMDAVHTVRHERYTVNTDTASGAAYFWQDHTISLAEFIFKSLQIHRTLCAYSRDGVRQARAQTEQG